MEKGKTDEVTIKSDLIPENDEMNSKEYLGTFRWKRSLKFPILPKITKPINYLTIAKWSDFITARLTQNQFEPYVIDALSYPLSVIYSLNEVISNKFLSIDTLKEQDEINIVILGASSKTECRIALESNYFDEIYYYLLQMTLNKDIKVNLYFVGEEVPKTNSSTSTSNPNLTYYFSPLNTGDFLKENIMSFSKKNTIIYGLNCGFGAGYMKLTYSWFCDLIKLIKIGYVVIFTYTNDYEDKKGEVAIVKDVLGGKIVLFNNDNPFKSMTTYKSEDNDNMWACGNYGYYVLQGGDRATVNKMSKLKKEDAEEIIKKTITIKA